MHTDPETEAHHGKLRPRMPVRLVWRVATSLVVAVVGLLALGATALAQTVTTTVDVHTRGRYGDADVHGPGRYGNNDAYAPGGDRDVHVDTNRADGHTRARLDAEPAAGPPRNISRRDRDELRCW